MFLIALKILLYDKVRSLITLMGVIFAVCLIFAQVGIYMGLMEASSILIDNTEGDIWVISKNSRNFDFAQPFPEYFYEQALSVEGVKSAEKLVVAWHLIKNKQGGTEQIEIVGFNPDTGIGGPWKMVTGMPYDVKNGDFFIVDESSMKRLGNIKVGDYREVGRKRLKLVGISEGVRSFTTAPMVFTSYNLAQRVVEYVGPDCTVFIVIKAAAGYNPDLVVEKLKSRLKDVDIYTKEDFSMKTRLYWSIETGIGFSFLLTILISFAIGILIVGQTIYNSTVEHIKEFGTLKALGAFNVDIYKIIFSQAILNALIGFILSLAISLVSVKIYKASGMVMIMTAPVNIAVLAMTLLMCLAAAFVSIRKIRKIDPAILFRG
ncbi:MAG: ABC transporter permease [Dissulfurispiraceae bacterium]|jgi:putative ABC transport system permease protein|nr:ABC transporter permease [Dissulfurispiraceae bacterium]